MDILTIKVASLMWGVSVKTSYKASKECKSWRLCLFYSIIAIICVINLFLSLCCGGPSR